MSESATQALRQQPQSVAAVRIQPFVSRSDEKAAKLLDNVEAARRGLNTSKDAYMDAVLEAHRHGISNVRIAGRAGLTEAAIRMMIKRGVIK